SDLEFGAPGSAAGEHQWKRLIDLPQLGAETRHHLGEVAALDLPAMTEPVHQRHRVRGGVLDMRITVEDEDAVSDPRFAVPGPARGITVREGSLNDHRHQGHGRFPVVLLQPGGAAAASLLGIADDGSDRLTVS